MFKISQAVDTAVAADDDDMMVVIKFYTVQQYLEQNVKVMVAYTRLPSVGFRS